MPAPISTKRQGINADTNRDGSGAEAFDLSIPAITAFQEAYVRKVIDAVNEIGTKATSPRSVAVSFHPVHQKLPIRQTQTTSRRNDRGASTSSMAVGQRIIASSWTVPRIGSLPDWTPTKTTRLPPMAEKSSSRMWTTFGPPPLTLLDLVMFSPRPSTNPHGLFHLRPSQMDNRPRTGSHAQNTWDTHWTSRAKSTSLE